MDSAQGKVGGAYSSLFENGKSEKNRLRPLFPALGPITSFSVSLIFSNLFGLNRIVARSDMMKHSRQRTRQLISESSE